MTWKDDFLARLKRERVRYLQDLEWLQTAKFDIENVSSSGHLESERAILIDHHQRIIAELSKVIFDLERPPPT